MQPKLIPLLFVVLLALSFSALGQTPSGDKPATGAPKIAVSKMQHDFGEIKKR